MRHRSGTVLALIVLAFAPAVGSVQAQAPAPGTEVHVSVTGLRSTKGQVLICLTTKAKGFPDCSKDPSARKLAVPAGSTLIIQLGAVPPGQYAISLLHDENGNGKVDTFMMMPKEGFGFSRDAPVRFGPPSFAQAAFMVGGEPINQTIKMRYML